MATNSYLGEFEHLVLLAIARGGGKAGGAQIHAELEATARRGASLPAIYVTLGRLERKGFVRTGDTMAQEEGAGRPRRLFAITRAGAVAMNATRSALERMWLDVPSEARSRR
jgi:PadR family transcriptional regulator, regulatory protein PadR